VKTVGGRRGHRRWTDVVASRRGRRATLRYVGACRGDGGRSGRRTRGPSVCLAWVPAAEKMASRHRAFLTLVRGGRTAAVVLLLQVRGLRGVRCSQPHSPWGTDVDTSDTRFIYFSSIM
jgi:hypothetical protein